MKTVLVFAALALGVATSHQAVACDWMHEANQGSTTIVCANGRCEGVQQTAKLEPGEAAPVEAAPPVPKGDVERADLAPITVTCQGNNC